MKTFITRFFVNKVLNYVLVLLYGFILFQLNALNDMVKRNSDPEILEKFTEMKYNLREAGLINCVTLFKKLSQTLYSNPPNICKCELNEYFTSDRCTPVHKIKVL